MKKVYARKPGKRCKSCKDPIFIGFRYIPLRRNKCLCESCYDANTNLITEYNVMKNSKLLIVLLSVLLCGVPFLSNYMAKVECYNFENIEGFNIEYIEWDNCYIEIRSGVKIKYSGIKDT